MPDEYLPPVDNPIRNSAEDVLDRAAVARGFAKSLRRLDASEGVVVGVLGPWGSGKSSFINLMKEGFDAPPTLTVIDFNPWMFSGTQQLVDVFFREIASELRLQNQSKFSAIADSLDEYSDVLSPVALIPFVGGYFDRSLKAFKTARRWWKERGATPLRKKVSDGLAALENPIVVVIDDIDRLSTQEIRDIFKLVRLTASFPNVIYLLAFDRLRVEAALDETNVPGRAYLEKIVQLSFDLPAIPDELLRRQIFEKLDPIVDGVENIRFNSDAWPDVFVEIVEPLIGSLRDVTRLTLSAHPTIESLGEDIEVVDVIALEAIRVFRPELFQTIRETRDTLTTTGSLYGNRDTKPQQAQIERLIAAAPGDAEVVKKLIGRLFPAARQYTENTHYGEESKAAWKRDHRVAHIDFLNLYFDRTAPTGLLSFRRAEKAYARLVDADSLAKYLDDLNAEDLEDTISGLEVYENDYPVAAVVPASTVLMNRIHAIPERAKRGMFDFGRPDIVVGRVVLRLLRRIEDETERESAVRSILSELVALSTQQDLIESVGHNDGVGHKLVSEACASELEEEFANRVQTDGSTVPDEEWDLLRVYWRLAERLAESYIPPTFSPAETRALIKSGRTVAQSQSMDTRIVREEEHLWWDGLIKVFGGEESLVTSIDALRDVDGDTPLVHLAEKYKAGWRPKRS